MAEQTTLSVRLRSLDAEGLDKVRSYFKAHNTDLDTFVEGTLVKYLRSCEETFEDVMDCPHCHLVSGRKVPLKGLPLLEAEKRGLIRLRSQETRDYAESNGTYFVICLDCLWWGFPDRAHMRK